MKIWCLFSVDNAYDQPEFNLVCWWREKPSIETFAKTIGVKLGDDDKTTVNLVKVWTGEREMIGFAETVYHMREVAEATALVDN